MMFSSVRSRLWVTYLLLSLIILSIVAVGVFLSLINNPIVYRQAINDLRTSQNTILTIVDQQQKKGIEAVKSIIAEQLTDNGTRYLLVNKLRTVVYDSSEGKLPVLTVNRIDRFNLQSDLDEKTRISRDANGRAWLYVSKKIEPGLFLITAVRLPALQLLAVFRDEFVSPILWAGIVAFMIAFVFALFVSRWISLPIQKISQATERFSSGDVQLLNLEGPEEVKKLARVYNNMATTVQSSRQSQKELIANISHELKTPLTAIQGFTEAILDGTVNSLEGVKSSAVIIQSEATRMYRLVMDLLTLARMEAGRSELHLTTVELHQIIENVLEQFKDRLQKAGVQLSLEIPISILINADEDRMIEVFTNLIDNAIKHTDPGGQITISAILGSNQVVVQVKDTGSGIPAAQLPHIFDRFFQAAGQTNRKSGTGLGLAITREIIQAHGGTIAVQSAIDKGTTFTIKLPL